MKRLSKALMFGLIAAGAGGCGFMQYAENPHPWPSERRLLAKDWVVPQVKADEEPVYCYRTLGKVDCHGDPLGEAEQSRVLGTDETGTVRPVSGN